MRYDEPDPGSAGAADVREHEVVVVIAGCAAEGDLAALCASLTALFAGGPAQTVTCDVAHLAGPAGSVVELLARLALTARRCGGAIRLRHPAKELVDLIALAGLGDVLATCAGSGGQPGRQAEQREERRVEVGVDADDPTV